jgi:hypothetical protein
MADPRTWFATSGMWPGMENVAHMRGVWVRGGIGKRGDSRGGTLETGPRTRAEVTSSPRSSIPGSQGDMIL